MPKFGQVMRGPDGVGEVWAMYIGPTPPDRTYERRHGTMNYPHLTFIIPRPETPPGWETIEDIPDGVDWTDD